MGNPTFFPFSLQGGANHFLFFSNKGFAEKKKMRPHFLTLFPGGSPPKKAGPRQRGKKFSFFSGPFGLFFFPPRINQRAIGGPQERGLIFHLFKGERKLSHNFAIGIAYIKRGEKAFFRSYKKIYPHLFLYQSPPHTGPFRDSYFKGFTGNFLLNFFQTDPTNDYFSKNI